MPVMEKVKPRMTSMDELTTNESGGSLDTYDCVYHTVPMWIPIPYWGDPVFTLHPSITNAEFSRMRKLVVVGSAGIHKKYAEFPVALLTNPVALMSTCDPPVMVRELDMTMELQSLFPVQVKLHPWTSRRLCCPSTTLDSTSEARKVFARMGSATLVGTVLFEKDDLRTMMCDCAPKDPSISTEASLKSQRSIRTRTGHTAPALLDELDTNLNADRLLNVVALMAMLMNPVAPQVMLLMLISTTTLEATEALSIVTIEGSAVGYVTLEVMGLADFATHSRQVISTRSSQRYLNRYE